jgi:hypothetical protein
MKHFYNRDAGKTTIATLAPSLPQTIGQCEATFGGTGWQELTETLISNFTVAYLGDSEYDIPQCRELTKDRLRIERKSLFEAQDILFIRAQETGADTSTIVAEKQRLRGITTAVDACTELVELSALNCSA